MTINTAYRQLLYQLYELYDNREAANIADWVIEYITGQKRIDRIIYKNIPLNNKQTLQLSTFTDQLLQHKPVQYVLNEAWFAGMQFYIDESVLIPRPETEELVEMVIKMYDLRGTMYDIKAKEENLINTSQISNQQLQIIDIGTGSGCVSIALKKKLQHASITAIDISDNALAIAKKNATLLQTEILFKQVDFLDDTTWANLGQFDVIVSNPPYIKQSESSGMSKHVTSYEPSQALFVADNDALIFYKKIALFGKQYLANKGQIFVEINEAFGSETIAVFNNLGYKTALKKDLQGKDRIILAWLTDDVRD